MCCISSWNTQTVLLLPTWLSWNDEQPLGEWQTKVVDGQCCFDYIIVIVLEKFALVQYKKYFVFIQKWSWTQGITSPWVSNKTSKAVGYRSFFIMWNSAVNCRACSSWSLPVNTLRTLLTPWQAKMSPGLPQWHLQAVPYWFGNHRPGVYDCEGKQILALEELKELENHHVAISTEIVHLGTNYQWLLKPVGQMLTGNFIIDGSGW